MLGRHIASIRTLRDVKKYWQGGRLFAFLFFDKDVMKSAQAPAMSEAAAK